MAKVSVHDRSVWVIGASSGIGAALAEELLRRGARVAISARRLDRLEEVSRDRMVVVPVDVTDRADVDRAASTVRAAFDGSIDIVIHAAAYWEPIDALHYDADVFTHHIDVNLLGLNNCLAAVLPAMVARRDGHIVGIASVAGYRGLPRAEAYGATKAAQINLYEALGASLGGTGVLVTTVAPGFVRTELTAKNTFRMPLIIEADAAARHICDGIERRRVEIVFPATVAVAAKLMRLLPVRAWRAFARRAGRGDRQ